MDDAWHDDGAFAQLEGDETFVAYAIGAAGVDLIATGVELYCDVNGPADAGLRVLFPTELEGIAVSTHLQTNAGVAVPIEADASLVEIATDLLEERDIDPAMPTIVQAFRTDIDRDGVPERLMVIDRNAGGYPSIGDHSIVVLVQGIGEDVETAVIVEDAVTELASDDSNDLDNWFYTGIQYRVEAIADVNGDNVDEVYVSWIQYEEWGDALFDWNERKAQWSTALAKECQL